MKWDICYKLNINDRKIEIDILIVTKDEKKYVAECKWRNHKVNKKELHKIHEKCEKLDLSTSP